MNNADATKEGSKPLTGRQALLAYVAERLRENPSWDHRTDPAYNGPHPTILQLMSDADFDRVARKEEERRLQNHSRPVEPQVVVLEVPTRRPRPPVRAALPFGQRLRELRCALGWTQSDVALAIGVSMRTVIRYEKGQSGPIQIAPLRTLRRLESDYANELNTVVYFNEQHEAR